MFKRMIALCLLTAFLGTTVYASTETVFATKNGTKYHKETCPLIKNKGAQSMEKNAALEKHLEPCKKCFKGGLKEDTSMKKNQETKVKQKQS